MRQALLHGLPRPRRAARASSSAAAPSALEKAQRPARLRRSRHRRRAADRAGAAASCRSRWRRERYRPRDLDGMFLVVAATPMSRSTAQVYADAEARSLLCNVADVPELCNFILPAVHRDGTRSRSPSRPAAPRRRSPSGSATSSARRSTTRARRARPPAARAAALGAGATSRPTSERRDYFEALVEEALG